MLEHNMVDLRGGRDDPRQSGVCCWKEEDQPSEQVSHVFVLNLRQQRSSPRPDRCWDFPPRGNKLKERAVSCFYSPIPSGHYSPNYCHPIHHFLYASWLLANATPLCSVAVWANEQTSAVNIVYSLYIMGKSTLPVFSNDNNCL